MNEPAKENQAAPALERFGPRRLVFVACTLSLTALLLMVWSVLNPTPLPVMVVMTVGQVLGTLGLACYLGAVFSYQWRRRRSSRPPPPAE